MEYLSKLSPAESFMVLNDKTPTLDELIELTFKDLVLKQVLKVGIVKKQGNRAGTYYIYKYVEKGSEYNNYQPQDFEAVFYKAIEKDKDAKVLYRRLITLAFDFSKSKEHYRLMLTKSVKIQACFKANFFQKIFGIYGFSSRKIDIKHAIEQEIIELEPQIANVTEQYTGPALRIINQIKGNIFLFKSLNKDIKKVLELEF